MPSSTYNHISNHTFNGSQSTITFNSLPTTFRSFRLVFQGACPNYLYLRFNGDTNGNYLYTRLYRSDISGFVNQTTSYQSSLQISESTGSDLGNAMVIVDVINPLTASDSPPRVKNILSRKASKLSSGGGGTNIVEIVSGVWSNYSSVINSITFYGGSNFVNGSTVVLFGIG